MASQTFLSFATTLFFYLNINLNLCRFVTQIGQNVAKIDNLLQFFESST